LVACVYTFLNLKLSPESEKQFFRPKERISVSFSMDEKKEKTVLSFYDNGMWSFDAEKENF